MATIEELKAERLSKLKKLKEKGIDPYPIVSDREYELAEVSNRFTVLKKKKKLIIAGRVRALRLQGGLAFCDIDDGTGSFQVLVKKDEVGEEIFSLFVETIDMGDFVEFAGGLFNTKRGEKTLQAKSWRMLAKSILPLPDKWDGLSDVEERFRKRYLDIISSPKIKSRFLMRSRIISELRGLLEKAGFVEVETSVLQSMAGGATALPFKTRHNALGMDMFLRIAKELDLKKLLVGGFPKIFEIGRDFRNEGIDATHNPEFTMVEWYEAYSDAEKQMIFVEKLFRSLVKSIFKGTAFDFNGKKIETKNSFGRIPYYELIQRYALIDSPEKSSREDLALFASRMGIKSEDSDGREKILDLIYKKACRPKIEQPTFIVDYPVNMLPLAKKNVGGKTVSAFQLIIGGMEVVKAFSELNDPIDQAERFAEQEKDRAKGDLEAQATNKDFLEALEHGMPPAGGVGIGIDRLVMLLTDTHNIREVIFFPTLRPKGDK